MSNNSGYSIITGGAITLAAATPKTVLGIQANSNFATKLTGAWISFEGVAVGPIPVLCELCLCTYATNAPGAGGNSTSVTVKKKFGQHATTGWTGGKNWTAEPTVLDPVREFSITPTGGFLPFEFPLSTELYSELGQGIVLRCTVKTGQASVDIRATLDFERG